MAMMTSGEFLVLSYELVAIGTGEASLKVMPSNGSSGTRTDLRRRVAVNVVTSVHAGQKPATQARRIRAGGNPNPLPSPCTTLMAGFGYLHPYFRKVGQVHVGLHDCTTRFTLSRLVTSVSCRCCPSKSGPGARSAGRWRLQVHQTRGGIKCALQ
jgi:hypothetical protein